MDNFINPAVDFEKEYIICAAIHFDDGVEYAHQPVNIKTGYIVCGRRHHNCFMTVKAISGDILDIKIEKTQGFLTSKDMFLDRYESMLVAIACNQVKVEGNEDSPLFSEDLY
jgi:hypothetical protein